MQSSGIKLSQRELKIGIFLLIGVSLLTVLDLFEDAIEGVEWTHVLIEALIIVFSLLGAVTLWVKSRINSQLEKALLESALNSKVKELDVWKAKVASLNSEFQEAIDHQFKVWGLTDAESEVGGLLLKGLSFKEIANLRSTSEQTVRQQAGSIYNRSGLEGRAQFSAFFLDDLFKV